jgi:hypothetical protein
MNMPGFTAGASLSQTSTQVNQAGRRQDKGTTNGTTGKQAVTLQFVGERHCWWECIPGTGCGYVCEFHPF